jgi:hypothetical protein
MHCFTESAPPPPKEKIVGAPMLITSSFDDVLSPSENTIQNWV